MSRYITDDDDDDDDDNVTPGDYFFEDGDSLELTSPRYPAR